MWDNVTAGRRPPHLLPLNLTTPNVVLGVEGRQFRLHLVLHADHGMCSVWGILRMHFHSGSTGDKEQGAITPSWCFCPPRSTMGLSYASLSKDTEGSCCHALFHTNVMICAFGIRWGTISMAQTTILCGLDTLKTSRHHSSIHRRRACSMLIMK